MARVKLRASEVRIGPRFPLIDDFLRHFYNPVRLNALYSYLVCIKLSRRFAARCFLFAFAAHIYMTWADGVRRLNAECQQEN